MMHGTTNIKFQDCVNLKITGPKDFITPRISEFQEYVTHSITHY